MVIIVKYRLKFCWNRLKNYDDFIDKDNLINHDKWNGTQDIYVKLLVLTLYLQKIWIENFVLRGLAVVSKNRLQRIHAIAEMLATTYYDVVCLQEVWLNSDYELIRNKVLGVLPYSHYFYRYFTSNYFVSIAYFLVGSQDQEYAFYPDTQWKRYFFTSGLLTAIFIKYITLTGMGEKEWGCVDWG